MRKDINKPLYVLIGLLFVALIVQGYFIYDLKKASSSEQNQAFSISSIPLQSSVKSTNDFTDPFVEMQKIQTHMMKEFGNFNSMFANDPFFQNAFAHTNMSAKFDIIDKGKEYVVEINIPGVDEKNIEIKSENRMIQVSARSQSAHESNSTNYIHKESFGDYFERSFTMPEDANIDTIKSEYKNGILTLVVEKNR